MEFSFENSAYNKLLYKIGITGSGMRYNLSKVMIPIAICWLPLALITLFQGNFWTGSISDSFITHFDTQIRFLVSLPILILSEKLISTRLGLILGQFKNSGIINKEEYGAFDSIIQRNVSFLKSKWTYVAILLFCYIQVFLVLFYESENTSMLSWQIESTNGVDELNFGGWWSSLISRPIVLFLFLSWLLRIIVWGWMLRKISKLNLNLFAVHPDLCGGLGFLGYALRFFSPIAFAISAAIAGNMLDFIMIEGVHFDGLKLPALAYFIFITVLFTMPLLSFSSKLVNAREQSVFENYDYANGIYRELRAKFAKGYDKVNAADLSSPDFSGASDLSAVIENALNMKFVPFTLKDYIPLWLMTALPFLVVIIKEIPISDLLKMLSSILV